MSEVRRIRGVGAIVFDAAGRLLLVQRAHEPAKGLWSVPGGKVEPGESDAEAVAREVFEETGLRVRVGALAGSVERPAGAGTIYQIYDYDAVLLTDNAGDDGGAASPGRVAGGGGAGPGRAAPDDVDPGDAAPDDAGPGHAASDAADLRWVDPAELPGLALTPGLLELLREWGRLP